MKHPHYESIVQWAQDTSQTVWCSVFGDLWTLDCEPSWSAGLKYHIGPTPPKDTRTLGGLEYPAPETEAPKHDDAYYIPALYGEWCPAYWDGHESDYYYLEAGLVHLTKEAAEAHARAILAAIKQANQGE